MDYSLPYFLRNFTSNKEFILPDIIQLLPDNIANQIAAGEVIQRPASAVKELLENAVDAGANEIKLIVNDAGKALIQVIDNGKGMSDTDARMCFERHATSKIKNIEDLFHIKTMGFRGEALASIAAVAQVELKSKKEDESIGTYIEIDNSVVKKQEPVAMERGTSIAMKNLFFNVPARRNFLKSNPSELRHIMDEFIRVSMSFPDIFFSLTSNGQEVFHLERATLKQRIVQILGNSYQSKLVTVEEQTDYMNIYGFVGKPETAKKTRGDQYFFVNNRFIKSAYLNHAVMGAFDSMIAKDSFPMYTLFIDLDPAQLDINVHPTKQEIKFEDEKIVYAFVQSAVKHALAQFSISPTLDFELDPSIQQLDAVSKPFTDEKKSSVASSSLYNTFSQKNQAHFIERTGDSNAPLRLRRAQLRLQEIRIGGMHLEAHLDLRAIAPALVLTHPTKVVHAHPLDAVTADAVLIPSALGPVVRVLHGVIENAERRFEVIEPAGVSRRNWRRADPMHDAIRAPPVEQESLHVRRPIHQPDKLRPATGKQPRQFSAIELLFFDGEPELLVDFGGIAESEFAAVLRENGIRQQRDGTPIATHPRIPWHVGGQCTGWASGLRPEVGNLAEVDYLGAGRGIDV